VHDVKRKEMLSHGHSNLGQLEFYKDTDLGHGEAALWDTA
jgi:hypothetical protein